MNKESGQRIRDVNEIMKLRRLILELDEEQTKHKWAEDFLVSYRMAS